MAGTVASPLLDMVCHRLDSHTRALSKSTNFIKMRLKLAETLAFLEETEHHESGDNSSIKIWLTVLRDLAYDVDVLIDDWEQQSNKIPRPSSYLEKELRRIHGQLVSHLDSYFRLVPGHDVPERANPEMDFYGSDIVYGRYSEMSGVINNMFSGNDGKILRVIPIVGMGGIGKTVFARRIFQNDEVKSHFQVKAWVSAGENLDLAKIEESVASQSSLEGKKFLLVLDDVWEEDGKKLQELKEWLTINVGDSGSCCVLLTTRSSRVAALAGTVPAKQLECWSDEDSWALFRCLAFGPMQDESIEFEKIGLKIIAKCKGLPLAIKVVGGLLRCKNKQEWLSIRRHDLSNLPEFKAYVLPVLKLSYHRLPPTLKQCLVYCSIFPKGYWINKEKLVQLWIAEGFVGLESRDRGLEDIANEYFSELFQNSFFLDVMRDEFSEVAWCRMHDFMHDLAQFVAGVECEISLSQIGQVVSHKMHDLAQFVWRIECSSLLMGYPRSVQGRVQYCSMVTPEPGKLRTLLLLSGKLDNVASIFHMFNRLRVLDLSQSGLIELPVSIGILKHLRYLDLSHTYIRKIPNSISKLKQLQTLELSHCYNLEVLPSAITLLTKLRNLGISSCCSLIHMPSGIGKLKLLRKLPAFILGKRSDAAKLKELNLLNLVGRLAIKNLENVKILVDAQEAKIHEKVHIRSLELSWNRNADLSFDMSAAILEILRPPMNIKILCLKGYRGLSFPGWMNWEFPNLVKVSLIDCSCQKLPPLGGLPGLQDLYIKGFPAVLSIGDEFYGNGVVKGFPSLQQLEIFDMPNLVEWNSFPATAQGEQFPCLEKLTIEGCRILTELPFAPNIKNLAICNSNETLLNSLHHLPSLASLVIDNFHELESSPGDPGNPNSITKLTIHDCDSLEILFAAVRSLSSVRHLSILHCDKVDLLPMSLEKFDSLQKLEIVNCPRLFQIPDILHQLSCLVELTFENCPILELKPESIRLLSSIQILMIQRCPLLEKQLEIETTKKGVRF